MPKRVGDLQALELKSTADLEDFCNKNLPSVETVDPMEVRGVTFPDAKAVISVKPDGSKRGVFVTGPQTPSPTPHGELLETLVKQLKGAGQETICGNILMDEWGRSLRAQIWLLDAQPKLNEPHRIGFEIRNGYDGHTPPSIAGAVQTQVCSNGLVLTKYVGQSLSIERSRRTHNLPPLTQQIPEMVKAAWEQLDQVLPQYDSWRERAKSVVLPDPRRFLTRDLGMPAATALKVVDLAGYLTQREDTSSAGRVSVVQVHDAITQAARDHFGAGPVSNDDNGFTLSPTSYDRMQEYAVSFREALPLTAVAKQ